MFLYYLLRAHAGFGENGELLGVPILTESQTVESNFNLPRASFQACVEQIYSDLSKAEEMLPWEYEDCLLYTSWVDPDTGLVKYQQDPDTGTGLDLSLIHI